MREKAPNRSFDSGPFNSIIRKIVEWQSLVQGVCNEVFMFLSVQFLVDCFNSILLCRQVEAL